MSGEGRMLTAPSQRITLMGCSMQASLLRETMHSLGVVEVVHEHDVAVPLQEAVNTAVEGLACSTTRHTQT